MTCQWCGDQHAVDQLCQRAQRGMTRRSFCFLFGAGIACAMLHGMPLGHRVIVIKEWPSNWYVRTVNAHIAEDVTIAYGYGDIDRILEGHETVMSVQEARAYFDSHGVDYGLLD